MFTIGISEKSKLCDCQASFAGSNFAKCSAIEKKEKQVLKPGINILFGLFYG